MIRKESFEAVYTDLHIHTSENPEEIKLKSNYDLEELLKKINIYSKNCKKMISFTDHNIINKKVYLSQFPEDYYLILGVEIHVSYDKLKKPYHCHIFFNIEINDKNIDSINSILDELYPKKEITKSDYSNIPNLETIINKFSNYDFLLLPHGGQNHATFNKAMPKGAKFDNIMEKVLYYNQFDGFTARSNSGILSTQNYFKNIGIDEFTNLITCSDNYNPKKYPNPKSDDAEKFIPTWIISEPTFNGLKLALSESGRLFYSDNPPKRYEEFIKSYYIKNDSLDIDVEFKQGLNVIVGESSSGKSLLVDTLARKIRPDLGKVDYSKNYNFDDLKIDNPAGFSPYYINQNYISEVANQNKIESIPIIKQMFGPTKETTKKTTEQLNKLEEYLSTLFNSVEEIEKYQNKLSALTNIDNLILFNNLKNNPLDKLFPPVKILDKLEYQEELYNKQVESLNELLEFKNTNIYIEDYTKEILSIKQKLKNAYEKSNFEKYIRKIVKQNKKDFDEVYKYDDSQIKEKSQMFNNVLLYISKYLDERKIFDKALSNLSKFKYTIKSTPIKVAGHQLYIENKLEVDSETIKEYLNEILKTGYKIDSINDLKPSNLFFNKVNGNFSSIKTYDDFKNKVFEKIKSNNRYTYKIVTSNNKKWEDLSPGWKTAILTELILRYDKDQATLIIDQPEDNLANKYINDKLIKDIKAAKIKKQIIVVSHNATIPILADAENIIYCRNDDKKIIIRSNYMENNIDGKPCLDIIADITDGGKRSIRKRFKKYNIKTYKEDNYEV